MFKIGSLGCIISRIKDLDKQNYYKVYEAFLNMFKILVEDYKR